MVKLPSKDQLLEACTGAMIVDHPVLQATCELAALHTQRRAAAWADIAEIDCDRAELMRTVDRWVVANVSQPLGAAYLHTESVGMVIDRIAQYSIEAHASLDGSTPELHRHYLWNRLAELAVAYTDLAFEISAGLRKAPNLTYPVEQNSSNEQEFGHEHPAVEN